MYKVKINKYRKLLQVFISFSLLRPRLQQLQLQQQHPPSAFPLSAPGRLCTHLLKDWTGNKTKLSQGNTDLPQLTHKSVSNKKLLPGGLILIKLDDQTDRFAAAALNQSSSDESTVNEATIPIYPLRLQAINHNVLQLQETLCLMGFNRFLEKHFIKEAKADSLWIMKKSKNKQSSVFVMNDKYLFIWKVKWCWGSLFTTNTLQK